MTASFASLSLMSFPFFLALAAVTDLRRFIIPNGTCLGLMAGFTLCFAASGLGWASLALHLTAGFCGLALGFTLFATGVWGGGDGKLLAAAALWFAGPSALYFLLYTALAGGLLGLAALLFCAFKDRLSMFPQLAHIDFEKRRADTPYGVAIALGAVAAFPQTDIFAAVFA